MDNILQGASLAEGHLKRAPLARGIAWGFLGGLAGTMLMDLVLMGALSAVGLPALTCFSIVGNTVARFFSIQNTKIAGAIQLGVITHYLVGPLFGGIFGMLVTRVNALRANTLGKNILLAIIYVEILSQPILATTPILLKMTVPVTLQWYGGSFIMHLLMAVVLGSVVGYGLRSIPLATRRRAQ